MDGAKIMVWSAILFMACLVGLYLTGCSLNLQNIEVKGNAEHLAEVKHSAYDTN